VGATKLEQLRKRCAAVDQLVARQAAEQAEAVRRYRAMPGSGEAYADLEDAEQLYYLARHSQRQAHRALRRAEARHAALTLLFGWLPAAKRAYRSLGPR
jgi:hypothetical protein